MNFPFENTTEILDEHISGFRAYIFEMSDMPTLIYVRDTMTVKCGENGMTVGYSVLTDITSIKAENENLQFLNETVSCGMLKYTCDKNPKITYINQQMMDMIRFPEVRDGELDYFELYKENIYLMIPIEERRKFAHFLHQVYVKAAPVAGEMTVLRCDGTKARLYGWVTKVTDKDGKSVESEICQCIWRKQLSNESKPPCIRMIVTECTNSFQVCLRAECPREVNVLLRSSIGLKRTVSSNITAVFF